MVVEEYKTLVGAGRINVQLPDRTVLLKMFKNTPRNNDFWIFRVSMVKKMIGSKKKKRKWWYCSYVISWIDNTVLPNNWEATLPIHSSYFKG